MLSYSTISRRNCLNSQSVMHSATLLLRTLSDKYDGELRRDLQRIIAYITYLPSWRLLCEDVALNDDQIHDILNMWRRRCDGEPLSKIFNRREFYQHVFYVNKDVLDPRPESELIVDNVILYCKNATREVNILEIGVGSGAILFSVLSALSYSSGVGIDVSDAALAVASINAHQILSSSYEHRCLLLHKNIDAFSLSDIPSEWCRSDDYSVGVDVIISNPPYIAWHERWNIEDSVLHYDPHEALFADDNGLAVYKKIADRSVYLAREGARMFLEIAPWMVDHLVQLFAYKRAIMWPRHVYAFWRVESIHRDLSGQNRMIELQLCYA